MIFLNILGHLLGGWLAGLVVGGFWVGGLLSEAIYIINLLFETVVGSAKRPRLRLSGAAAEAPLGAFPRGYLGLW